MGIIDKLASVGVSLTTDPGAVTCSPYARDDSHPFQVRRRSIQAGQAAPAVSCLMVTRGDRWTIKYALECYRRQTYENRELVIAVDAENYERVLESVRQSNIREASVFAVDSHLTLGDCRNMSVARARGDILMQWDDDDLYDPSRIAVCVSALVEQRAAAALLSRWLVWWPRREMAAISGRRVWEGSIAVWREHARVYPNIPRAEDGYVTGCIANTADMVLIDAPLLYVYVVTENNTFNLAHYEKIIAYASYVARGDEYHALTKILSERVPMTEYLSEMLSRA
jgi:glycosyltransferase involved in cell wall biosynthesis